MGTEAISIDEAAERSGVKSETLERWVEEGLVPLEDGVWTRASAAQARIVERMADRGYSERAIRNAVRDGRLAFGYVEELLASPTPTRDRSAAAEKLRMDPDLVERIMTLLGTPMARADRLTDDDLEALWILKRILDSGFPLVPLLQLVRVHAQSMRRIAEAEVRLFHLYIHEPLIDDGVPALEISEQMAGMVEQLMPTIDPLMQYIHNRYLRHYIEQDVVGHMESDLAERGESADRLTMAFGFVDLTGFTRFTEEQGDEQAIDLIERFVESVEATLPSEATIVKTIGDEVMVVSPDPGGLAHWIANFMSLFDGRPQPRAGLHYGSAVYRDGDYFGGDVNLAHRVVNHAHAGETVVTEALADAIDDLVGLDLEPIGKVRLRGIEDAIQLMVLSHKRRVGR